ncbi:hypothetical protein IMSHALPRED_007108 [Imshaugia aleurites]|uniref:Uncharacterized protein n=1 Tax=Imshaugia aleurites TaxID=172621 RepID=A0A8H3FM40_9LECA|nr:hypothetical protein IMSHALPRED_007108 [Imshaugia aleurites]
MNDLLGSLIPEGPLSPPVSRPSKPELELQPQDATDQRRKRPHREDYLRRNWQISMYDLVVRAPNGYYKGEPETEMKKKDKTSKEREWHEGPSRFGIFSMRATRFRMRAGCLSWEKKDGTAAKN